MLNIRWLTLAALLATEIVWGINVLDVPDLSGQTGLVATLLGSAAQLFKVGVAFLATFLLILSRRFESIADDFRDQAGYNWWPWLAGHGIALATFLALSWPVLGGSPTTPEVSAQWLLATLATASVTFGLLLLAAAPAGVWVRFLSQERAGVAVAAGAGLLAWLSGFLTQEIWLPLAEMTLWSTRQLLSLFYTNVYYDDARTLVGANSFSVQIAPVCSGYEGMGLITVFVAVYLWLFRKELTFPRALWLLPAGIIVIWLANVVRVTALIAVGASISPDIAVTGFHSQAGWITFSVVALGLIAVSHRLLLSATVPHRSSPSVADPRLALALLAPLMTLLATSMFISAFSSGFAALYPLGVIATAAALWLFRGHYRTFARDVTWQAIAIGAGVFVLWMMLVPPDEAGGGMLAARLAEMPVWLAFVWLVFRVVGSVVTVPLAEELAFRGYLIRKLVAGDFENVRPGHFTWLSFILSSVLFGLLHSSWIAGALAGAGFALALYRRGQIFDAILAHMTSNALIAVGVLAFGRWSLWS